MSSAFAPLSIVVLLSAPSPLPCLSLSAISRTPLADARAAGLDRWLPEATGGVWRLDVTDAELDAIERDPACIVWGPVGASAAGERIETEGHRRTLAAEILSETREDWTDLDRGEQREAVDEWLADHPEVRVGAAAVEAVS